MGVVILDESVKKRAKVIAQSVDLQHKFSKEGLCRCGVSETSVSDDGICEVEVQETLEKFAQEVLHWCVIGDLAFNEQNRMIP